MVRQGVTASGTPDSTEHRRRHLVGTVFQTFGVEIGALEEYNDAKTKDHWFLHLKIHGSTNSMREDIL